MQAEYLLSFQSKNIIVSVASAPDLQVKQAVSLKHLLHSLMQLTQVDVEQSQQLNKEQHPDQKQTFDPVQLSKRKELFQQRVQADSLSQLKQLTEQPQQQISSKVTTQQVLSGQGNSSTVKLEVQFKIRLISFKLLLFVSNPINTEYINPYEFQIIESIIQSSVKVQKYQQAVLMGQAVQQFYSN
eukprot:TRINITY_DN2485_c0_g1_i1.p2 TRINITY_DN2485_c0_g1~~TRINITY_DN2485_c0_g1_i1.p2  ORF type:complete len:185 (+),score=7.66 TRINITY_DN2485_c0_g1_i1:271-825(+)